MNVTWDMALLLGLPDWWISSRDQTPCIWMNQNYGELLCAQGVWERRLIEILIEF